MSGGFSDLLSVEEQVVLEREFDSPLSPDEEIAAARDGGDDQAAYAQDRIRELEMAESIIDGLLEKKAISFDEATILRRFVW